MSYDSYHMTHIIWVIPRKEKYLFLSSIDRALSRMLIALCSLQMVIIQLSLFEISFKDFKSTVIWHKGRCQSLFRNFVNFQIFENFLVHLNRGRKWVYQLEFGSKSLNLDWNIRSKCHELCGWIIFVKISKFSKTVSSKIYSFNWDLSYVFWFSEKLE